MTKLAAIIVLPLMLATCAPLERFQATTSRTYAASTREYWPHDYGGQVSITLSPVGGFKK